MVTSWEGKNNSGYKLGSEKEHVYYIVLGKKESDYELESEKSGYYSWEAKKRGLQLGKYLQVARRDRGKFYWRGRH